ncbi:MAG TPA: Re/Si-specific NAD(P)(+) transhydrogenase subunit alpha [Gemmatimonadota bacterium]|jgi:NAD(P) transhydrogenase subunit alpha|nr:Re/Si-specific NAD(P)(+) transhydrogenase subunit alpha [Gemmatimonadota bacterium]
MRIGIPRETRADETRVAATPDVARKYVEKGASVVVESGAGRRASYDDAAYAAAGAEIGGREAAWSADVVLKVQPPDPDEAARLARGAVLVSFLYPESNPAAVAALERAGATVLAMESIPRIARAQKMDALSSMANLAGYKAVLEAANAFGRFFPLLMTAAGTIPPAQVLVIGAGVAGLSAIVTARRLGAVVRAFDPRPAVKEQVQSLGARFLDLELRSEETAGGYAAAQSEEFLQLERRLLGAQMGEVDVVIATALVRGQRAPVLVTDEMLRAMRPGSVVVDLAVEQGGNCEGSRADEVVDVHGVTVIGWTNFAARVPVHGSMLYARNVQHLVLHLWGEAGLALNFDDEIVAGAAVIHEGRRRDGVSPVPAEAPRTATGKA